MTQDLTSYPHAMALDAESGKPMPKSVVQLSGSNVQLLNAVSAVGVGTPQTVGTNKTYNFEVYGTATAFDVQIQAVGPSGIPRTLPVWDVANKTFVTDITAAGFYEVDTPRFSSLQANVVTVTGGSVSVAGGLGQ